MTNKSDTKAEEDAYELVRGALNPVIKELVSRSGTSNDDNVVPAMIMSLTEALGLSLSLLPDDLYRYYLEDSLVTFLEHRKKRVWEFPENEPQCKESIAKLQSLIDTFENG